jgi:Rrf2 family nitric oxide-sensitive transcriptional repressor
MRLTLHTDFALRVLIHLNTHPGRLNSISEIARGYGISHNHLTKVVHRLGKLGYVTTIRGRNGGIRLARPAVEINVGEVVRATEDSFQLVDCPSCILAPVCGLNGLLGTATQAFLDVLDKATLADISRRGPEIARLLDTAAA